MAKKGCKINRISIIFIFMILFLFTIESIEAQSANNFLSTGSYYEVLSLNNYSNVKYQLMVIDELEINKEVPVIIDVKDTSGITVSLKNTIEEQENLDALKKEILDSKIDSILSNLTLAEFKLKGRFITGHGFYGNITRDGFNKLINNSDIAEIRYDRVARINLDKSRPLINADDVENLGYNGTHQSICVLDTGVDYDHPALGGCFGSGCKVRAGHDYYSGDTDPDDDNGHGTFVTGIISSKDSNKKGIAADSRIVAMKVCDSTGGFCPVSAIRSALFYCYFNRNIYNITVVSISIGNDGEYPPNCPTDAKVEIDDLYRVGIPVVISSGNEGHTNGISWPACIINATSVGSVYDENFGTYSGSCTETSAVDKISCFTNRKVGILKFLAPGCRINTTKIGGGFDFDCGTSFAVPHVSGTAALLKELNKSLTVAQIEEALNRTGITVLNTYQRIDALGALNYIRDRDNDTYIGQSYGGDDCNDNNPGVHPGATDGCDGIYRTSTNITIEVRTLINSTKQ